MTRTFSAMLALLLSFGSLSSPNQPQPQPVETQAVLVDELAASQRAAQAEAAYAGFALDLLRSARTEGENTLLSPLSVTLALGMTAQGAHGKTAQQFAQVFGMEQDALASYCQALLEDYSHPGGSTQFEVANSLWCDPDLKLEEAFSARCKEVFHAQVYQADLQGRKAASDVNSWVKRATHGKIPSVIDRFEDDTVLALINAVYLKNKFQQPFETPTSRWTIDFHNADGTVSQPQGMRNGTRQERYLTHAGGQGVILPYDDGKLGLLLMLPDKDLSLTDYLNSWDGSTVKGLLDGQQETRVNLKVPKFKAQWGGSLKNALSALGLAEAFDYMTADFTSMGHSVQGYPLYINDVIHKTTFEINEKGTEATAVTVVSMGAGSAAPHDDIYLTFDRPFVYGIVDLDAGTPLFLGTVETLA